MSKHDMQALQKYELIYVTGKRFSELIEAEDDEATGNVRVGRNSPLRVRRN